MRNAHLRFGHLSYTKIFKRSTTHFTVRLDRFIGEAETNSQLKAHLVSVIGGDTQIAAIGAAIANRESFTVEHPNRDSLRVSLGVNAECYRGSISVEGYKRPLRHVVAISEELGQSTSGKNAERIIVLDDSPQFIWASIAHAHGVPGVSEWAEWVVQELRRVNALESLIGIGCSPVLVKGPKGLFMNAISRGLRDGNLCFPDNNGSLQWNGPSLSQVLLPELG